MNDRELLELAARAIGGSHLEVYDIGDRHGVSGYFPEHPNSLTHWNPLTDDGDALRLAVMLGLLVDCDYNLEESEAMGRGSRQVVEHEDNPFAATRRAIVRAAAEVGKGM